MTTRLTFGVPDASLPSCSDLLIHTKTTLVVLREDNYSLGPHASPLVHVPRPRRTRALWSLKRRIRWSKYYPTSMHLWNMLTVGLVQVTWTKWKASSRRKRPSRRVLVNLPRASETSCSACFSLIQSKEWTPRNYLRVLFLTVLEILLRNKKPPSR